MAKKQEKKLDISRLSKLDWTEINSEEMREVVEVCDFCKKDIKEGDKYLSCGGIKQEVEGIARGFDRMGFDEYAPLAVACIDCGTAAGIVW